MDERFLFHLGSNNISIMESDLFFFQIYNYFYNKGYVPMILNIITELLSIIFGTVFSIFIFVYLDWESLLLCGDNNCGDISKYIIYKQINFFQFCVLIMSLSYLFYKTTIFIPRLLEIKSMKNFFYNTLEIKTNDIKWNDVLEKIRTTYTILDDHDITSKIMRKENYMIALIDHKIINIHPILYTKQLDMNIEKIILEDIENISKVNLKRKFIIYGILNIVFSIFIFLFHIVYFFVTNIDDFYSNKNVLGPRRYSILAKRKFREYNELSHFFEERLNKSIKFSNEYTKKFSTSAIDILARFITLICGAFIGLFVIISIMDERVLLYVKMFDRTLLFYTGIISAISSFCRGYIQQPEILQDPNIIMENIVNYTHYFPTHWENKCHTNKIRNEFLSLFPYKIIIFIYDLLSVFTTPYILIFVLPNISNQIVNFIKLNTLEDDIIGSICIFANKDKDKVHDNKMNKSLIYFNENHKK